MHRRGLLVVNADDWGGFREGTDAIEDCFAIGAISSTTAMVHMADSRRAAELALERARPTGLHLNLTQPYDAPTVPAPVRERQSACVRTLQGPAAPPLDAQPRSPHAPSDRRRRPRSAGGVSRALQARAHARGLPSPRARLSRRVPLARSSAGRGFARRSRSLQEQGIRERGGWSRDPPAPPSSACSLVAFSPPSDSGARVSSPMVTGRCRLPVPPHTRRLTRLRSWCIPRSSRTSPCCDPGRGSEPSTRRRWTPTPR